MNDEKTLAERLNMTATILDDILYPLAERTVGLADLLTDNIPDNCDSVLNLAFQIEINVKEIKKAIGDALKSCWPRSKEEVEA
jgi:hypothetical protein